MPSSISNTPLRAADAAAVFEMLAGMAVIGRFLEQAALGLL